MSLAAPFGIRVQPSQGQAKRKHWREVLYYIRGIIQGYLHLLPPHFPFEPLSPEFPQLCRRAVQTSIGSGVVAYPHEAEGGTYTTVRIPVAVNVRPSSWTMGSTRVWGFEILWNWLKVKWIFMRLEYCIRENCKGEEECPGAQELFFNKLFILAYLWIYKQLFMCLWG